MMMIISTDDQNLLINENNCYDNIFLVTYVTVKYLIYAAEFYKLLGN